MDLIEGSSDEDDTVDTSTIYSRRVEIISAVSFERLIPHTRGNWIGTVVCQVKKKSCAAATSVEAFRRQLEQFKWSGDTVVAHDDLHVSLSRPFALQLANIDPFVSELRRELLGLPTTNLSIMGHAVFMNDTATRSFWCWSLSSNAIILRILQAIDLILAKYHQPPYYQPPHFHVSTASIAGTLPPNFSVTSSMDHDHDDEGNSSISSGEEEEESCTRNDVIRIDHVVCTFGTTKTFVIPLQG